MSVSITEVEKIAALAKLSFSETEKQKLAEEMNAILGYMDQLNEVNTDGVEPLISPVPLSNVFREDTVQPSLERNVALKNAPDKTEEFFKIPRVLPGKE